jgi:hypothetical protein
MGFRQLFEIVARGFARSTWHMSSSRFSPQRMISEQALAFGWPNNWSKLEEVKSLLRVAPKMEIVVLPSQFSSRLSLPLVSKRRRKGCDSAGEDAAKVSMSDSAILQSPRNQIPHKRSSAPDFRVRFLGINPTYSTALLLHSRSDSRGL